MLLGRYLKEIRVYTITCRIYHIVILGFVGDIGVATGNHLVLSVLCALFVCFPFWDNLSPFSPHRVVPQVAAVL